MTRAFVALLALLLLAGTAWSEQEPNSSLNSVEGAIFRWLQANLPDSANAANAPKAAEIDLGMAGERLWAMLPELPRGHAAYLEQSLRGELFREGFVLPGTPLPGSGASPGSFADALAWMEKNATRIRPDGEVAARRDPPGKPTLLSVSGEFHPADAGPIGTGAAAGGPKLHSGRLLGADTAWGVGEDGNLWFTDDAGRSWRQRSHGPAAHGTYPHDGARWLLPAPWYFLGLFFVALLLVPALEKPAPPPPEPGTIADVLVSDRPLRKGDPDHLDFGQISEGLSRFIRNVNTQPPVTIAITGEWGTGKSSIMNLLHGDLEEWGYRPVWFNAWHHQQEKQILAALLESIRHMSLPTVFSAAGLRFRARLVHRRFARRWPVILALAFAVSFLALYMQPLLADGNAVESMWDLILVRGGLLAGIGASALATWKGLQAFWLRPAQLMASVASSFRVRDLEAQASFRTRFKAEFEDVTAALSPRSPVILIDDLDRCQKEKVTEILEAVNFLVSCGDCFVILGMARKRVESCVGLAFKDVAGEIYDPRIEPVNPDKEARARAQREEFARQYLEKLINIEVPVPRAAGPESAGLERLVTSAAKSAEPESRPPSPWQQIGASLRTLALPVALVVAVALGIWSGGSLNPFVEDQPAEPAEIPGMPSPRGESGGTGESDGASPGEPASPRSTSEDVETVAVEPVGDPAPALEAGSPSLWVWFLVAGLLMVGVWRLSIHADPRTHDSPEFSEALGLWFPLVVSGNSTPRSVKRFLNRVRYLAMRQRRTSAAEPLEERPSLPTRLRRLLLPEGPKDAPLLDGAIPESALVPLCAIEHAHPGWLEDDAFFRDPLPYLEEVCPPQVRRLGAAPELAALERYREEFNLISRGVRTT